MGPPEPWRWPRPLAALLRPLAWLYRLGWALSRALPRPPAARAGAPVLSVGNLSVGGTGKSLLARALAERARRRGLRPALLLRGYRAPRGPRPLRLRGSPAALERAGDEAREHARSGAWEVWVDPDRARAARAAVAAGARALVLDDGFQRRGSLARDLDLLLADYAELLEGERLLPEGPWREPWSQAALADAVLLSGAPAGLKPEQLRARLPRPWSGRPLFRLDRQPLGLRAWPGGARLPLARLRGREVLALSGLGRPAQFEAALRALGARVRPWRFPDHHPFRLAELQAPPAGAQAVVCTAKDAERLDPRWAPALPVWVLLARARVSPAAPFWRLVDAALAGRPPLPRERA